MPLLHIYSTSGRSPRSRTDTAEHEGFVIVYITSHSCVGIFRAYGVDELSFVFVFHPFIDGRLPKGRAQRDRMPSGVLLAGCLALYVCTREPEISNLRPFSTNTFP